MMAEATKNARKLDAVALGRILRNEWPANAGVNIAENTALPLIPGNGGLGPTGYVLGESCWLAAGGHIAENTLP